MKWVEHDPYTGVTEINVASDDDVDVTVHRVQDVEPLLDLTAETRNTKSADKKGNLNLYCSIPMVVCYELYKKGINVFNPDHMPRVLKEINSNYPYLRYTDKTHSLLKRRPASSSKGLGNNVSSNAENVGDSLVCPSKLAQSVEG